MGLVLRLKVTWFQLSNHDDFLNAFHPERDSKSHNGSKDSTFRKLSATFGDFKCFLDLNHGQISRA